MVGTVFAKRYRIGKLLGEGGMGSIYEAVDTESDRVVAVKLIAPDIRTRDVFVQRFEREAAITAALESPHIAALYATGVDDATATPFIIMERLVGEDLGALLARVRILPVDIALRIAIQACAGLEAAHAASVIHRDIKPSNLMLARDDAGTITVKLLDFGIAKLRAPDASSPALTQSGAVLGSPLYMSPEQARGDGDVDHRSDLWSLGIVLYQMLCGRTPQHGVDGLGNMIVAICTEPVAPIQDLAPWVPRDLAVLLRTLLALRRENRIATAAALRAALSRLVTTTELREELLVPITDAERSVIAERATPAEETTVTELPRKKREAKGSGARILVIEDNRLNMDMLTRRLSKKGYTVLEARDGESGIEIAQREKPDLILMDLGLPGIDGFTAVKTLRDSDLTRATPIIALTALASSDDRDRARQAGCNDYEIKPVDLPRLLAKIAALLGA